MSVDKSTVISPMRLRIGVGLIIIWWLPIWALAPFIADLFDSSNNAHLTATITLVIAIIQTIIGFLGIIVAGKEVKSVIKDNSKKQALGKIWHIILHGKVEN